LISPDAIGNGTALGETVEIDLQGLGSAWLDGTPRLSVATWIPAIFKVAMLNSEWPRVGFSWRVETK
jgi:hypothetical protein